MRSNATFKRHRLETWERLFGPIVAHPEEDPDQYIINHGFKEPAKWAEILAAHEERRVWTVVEGDNGKWYITDGIHIVNREGYIITKNPIPEGIAYEVLYV